MTIGTLKAQIYEQVETLSKDDLVALGEFLCRLQATENPRDRALLRASLREPEDLTEADRAALQEAREDVAAGRIFTLEDIRREFPPDNA
jgi:hypothetical protein